MKRLVSVSLLLSVTAVGLACAHSSRIDYEHADGALDAHRSFLDSGHFHELAVRVGDSVIAPSDTTAYRVRSYNVEVGPEGPIVFLPVVSSASRPGWPSDAQLRYLRAYNTALFAMLDTNALREPGLPPNTRLKLTAPRH